MQDIFREYGLFVMVTLVSATVWVVISYIMHWGGSNAALYANEDDSDAMQNQVNMTDIQEPRFVNFYITDSNGKNTANLRNVIGYNSPGKHKFVSNQDNWNWKCRVYGNYNGSTENWGFPYNTVYGYTAYTATGGYQNTFNNNKLSIEDYFTQDKLIKGERETKTLESLYLNQTPNGDYSLNIHVYRIFTNEEEKAIQSTYSAVTTNQVYSTNLIENKYTYGVGTLYNKNGNNTVLDITSDKLSIKGNNNKEVYGLYTKPSTDTLADRDDYDVSYKYTDASKKDKVTGKTIVSVSGSSNTWTLTVKTNGTTDFTWKRNNTGGVAVITEGSNELTDYDISTELSKYMWNLADTIRIKFFLSTATNSNLADYTNTLSKMIEAGDEKADITNKAVYLINTTFKYKLVYQYKNNITGMKAEQAYTITVDSNNS